MSESAVSASVPGMVTANSNVYFPLAGTGARVRSAVWKQTDPEEPPVPLQPPAEIPPIMKLQALVPPGAAKSVTELATSLPVLNCMETAFKETGPLLKAEASTVRNTSKTFPLPATNVDVAVYMTFKLVSVTGSAFADDANPNTRRSKPPAKIPFNAFIANPPKT